MSKFAYIGCFLFLISTVALTQTTDNNPFSPYASPAATPGQQGSNTNSSNGGAGAIPVPAVPRAGQITNVSPAQEATQQQRELLQEQWNPWSHIQPTPTPESNIEFEDLVSDSLGTSLPIFGANLFTNVPSTFAPLDRVQVTSDYIIEPGDELLIRAWGQIDVDFHAFVDRSGAIFVPKVGAFNVAGVRYAELHDYLESQIGRIYKNFQLSVTLGQLRAIQVYVVGQVKRPGTYTVSSLSSLLDALFSSGGPSKRGSLRGIQLKRAGKLITTFDIYDVIVNGDKTKDASLLPGDLIYVPPVGPLVALAGAVNTPAIYELKDHTTLGDVIGYAGGLANTAANERAIVERIDEHRLRRTENVSLDQQGLARELRDGDVVRLLRISPGFEDTITLRGNVARPGHYPWRQGMRVHDLIPTRESLIPDEYWKKQNELATDGLMGGFLMSGGKTDQTHVGEAQLKNDVKRVSSEINWEYAVIQRFDNHSLISHLLSFNLSKAIEGEESANLPLQANDVITIFSQADIQVPIAQQSKFVHLEGEVKEAGVHELQPGETLRHLLQRLGGFSPQAYLYGSEFTRESTRAEQQTRLDEYVASMEQTVSRGTAAASQALSGQQAALALSQAEADRALVERMKGLKATGRIILELRPTADSINALPDLALEDGDRLLVPFRPATVNVIGSVYNTAAFVYKPGKTVADYLRLAGGPRRDADKGREFVVRADGSTVSRQQHSVLLSRSFETLRLMPGDTIIVPAKVNRGGAIRALADYTTILSQFGIAAGGFRAIFP